MIDLATLGLCVATLYAIIQFGLHYTQSQNTKYIWYAAGAGFYFLTTLFWIAQDYDLIPFMVAESANISGWFQVSAVSLVLVALGIENWQDRPQLARFPYVFTFIPLLLIITYALVFDTVYLKEVIIGIYEGGAIMVALILFGYFFSKNAGFLIPVVGLVVLLLGFVVYWFPGDVVAANAWIWKAILATGCVCFVYGYPLVINESGYSTRQTDAYPQ